MLAKIFSIRGIFFACALALLLSGCTPAGPRALLKGKKCLDRGDTAEAVTQLHRATSLLATNANAWNYYGVALQRAGQSDDAAAAYENALKLDRDLSEAHFNLGCLALEQNKPELARAEFTAYTLRRPNEAIAWLKLGSAQLRLSDFSSAERSFSTVYHMDANNPDALNGLGLARVQRGKYREAAQFFAAAVQARPNFAPALLNLGTVNQQYLHDNKAALENFRNYLGLTPRPAGFDEVKAIVSSLEQTDIATTVMAPAVVTKPSAPPAAAPATETKARTVAATTRPATRVESGENNASRPPQKNAAAAPAPSELPVKTLPAQTVQVQPAPQIVATPRAKPPVTPVTRAAAPKPAPATNVATPESIEVPMPEEPPRHGFFHRLFGSYRTNNAAKPVSRGENLTQVSPPIDTTPAPTPAIVTSSPTPSDTLAETKPEEDKPAETKPAPVVSFNRYTYTSPARPAPGDRRTAEGAFTKARLAEQDENWTDALQWYQSASETDPAWFEAQYNAGVMAHRLKNFVTALPHYELALALQPQSVDARYNFALALKAAGYPMDAADELNKILAAHGDEVRAHLALANVCAQSLHDVVQARQHYLKVLELQPDNPQANDIRFWLSANSK